MGSLMIVVGEPAFEKPVPVVVRKVELGVGPLVPARTDEPFCFAVGRWAIGPGGPGTNPETGKYFSKNGRLGVAEGPIGENGLYRYPVRGEGGLHPGQEGGAGRTLFIGKRLDIGDACAVVPGPVQEVVPGLLTTLISHDGSRASEHAVTAAIREAHPLLGVYVHELSRTVFLVADHLTGGTIQIGESGAAVAPKNPVGGGRAKTQAGAELGGAETQTCALAKHLPHPGLRQNPSQTAWAARALTKPGLAFLSVVPEPLVDGRARNPGGFSHLSRRPADNKHAFYDKKPSRRGQFGLSMGHGSLLCFGLGLVQSQTEQRDSLFVNNVSGHYS